MTDDEEKPGKPMYIACNVKNLRIDEFHSLKFDSIKPKLFDNERPDELNNENVPPINIRIDFPKDESNPPAIITLQIEDRTLAITSHAIDIIQQNLEEKSLQKTDAQKCLPIDIHLTNVQLSLDLIDEYSTTQAVVEIKPPMKINIECMHLLRQIDGQIVIKKSENKSNPTETIPFALESKANSNNAEIQEKLQQAEMTRLENERLRSELNAHKKEITALRSEREKLMNTIAKLDIELTQAEYQRIAQQQQQQTGKKIK